MHFTMPAMSLLTTLMVSCTTKDSTKNEETPNNTTTNTQTNNNEGKQETPNACLIDNTQKPAHWVICTPEFISAQKYDGASCVYSSCKVPENGECPQYFVKGKTSSPPTESICSYHRPVEL